MAEQPVGFSPDGARRIVSAVKTVEEWRPYLRPIPHLPERAQPLLEGRLLTALAAPSDITPAPTAQLQVYRGAGADWQAGDVVTVVNRQPNWLANSGTQIVCALVNGEWRPLVGASSISGSGGTSQFHGCAPWICDYIDGQVISVTCGSITQAVSQYQFTFPATCTCCDGRVSGEPVILNHIASSCHWESDSFTCSTTGGSCGSAVWKWVESGVSIGDFGYANFEPKRNPGCVLTGDIWQWNNPPGAWSQTGTACHDAGCGGSTAPTTPGSYNGQVVVQPCNSGGGWSWLQTSNCNCGGIATPPSSPAGPSSPVTRVKCDPPFAGALCGNATEADWYLLSSDCNCGTALKPTFTGSPDQVVTTICRGPGSGYDTSARWRLTIGASSYLQLLTESDVEILRYDLNEQKTFCPLCQNVLDWTGPCGPHDCTDWPDQVCIGPYIPPLPDCTSFNPLPYSYDLTVSSIDNAVDYGWPLPAGVNWSAMNGTFNVSFERLGILIDNSGAGFGCLDGASGEYLYGTGVVYQSTTQTQIYTISETNIWNGHTDVVTWYGRWKLFVCCVDNGRGYARRFTAAVLTIDKKSVYYTGTQWEYGIIGPISYGTIEAPAGSTSLTLYLGGDTHSSYTATATMA